MKVKEEVLNQSINEMINKKNVLVQYFVSKVVIVHSRGQVLLERWKKIVNTLMPA